MKSLIQLFTFFWVTLLGSWNATGMAQENSKQEKQTQEPVEIVKRDVEGWSVKIEKSLLDDDPVLAAESLKALANHLQRVQWIVAEQRLKELRELPIWIGHNDPRLELMQYHPGSRWLIENGHDKRLVKHVHIPRAKSLLDRNNWSKHPYCVMHELAHAYHDQILGFNHPEIKVTFEDAKKRGIYETVLAHTGEKVVHYGLNNHKEYFAESTEAYFGVNDFFPFVRAELKEHDPKMHSLLRKIWGPIR